MAKLGEIKRGMLVFADGGFTCMQAGPKRVYRDKNGLYIHCGQGKHYLEGQLDDNDEYVGLEIK